MPIPLKTVAAAIRNYSAIQKDAPGTTIEIEPENFWVGASNEWHFVPRFGGITNIRTLASVCQRTNWYLPVRGLTAEGQRLPFITELLKTESLAMVQKTHTSLIQSPVKYYFETVRGFTAQGFGIVVPLLITATPVEVRDGDQTYRVVTGKALITYGDGYARDSSSVDHVVFAVGTDSPYYNYLDRGHVMFFCSKTGEDPTVFIANQLSLNVYSLAALFSVNAERIKPLLRNEVFLYSQNSAELQRILAQAERELPEKYGVRYNTLKAAIRADFEKNSQNVLVTKFQRAEIKEITLNNIKFSSNKAVYETITVQADGLADVILHRLDTNGVFDIYQLVDAYINSILEEMNQVPKAANGQGFAEARTWNFTINNIPISVALSTTNTRRRVNGHLINNDELLRVIRRATCYTDAGLYDKFLRQIERASLRVHDALANGVPLKIFAFDRYSDYQREVTNKHPKIFFVYEEGKYFLWLDKAKTTKVPLRRFVGLLDALKTLNVQTNNGYVSDNSGFPRRNTDWCQWKLRHILREHAQDAKGAVLVTEAQLKPLVDWLLEARVEAEKRSQELLASVVKETGARQVQFKGLEAYEINGNSGRTYAVEKESFKVWDAKTNDYVCIVDGRGEQGVGYDALVARLLALRNDTFVVDRIGTLKEPIRRQTAEVPAAQPAPAGA